jgi:integrin beta 3
MASLPIFDHNICKNKLEQIHPIGDGIICAGGQSGKNTCVRYSGSPLQCNVKGKWVLMGVTSRGIDCHTSPGFSRVYTRVPYYVKWIRKTIKKN